MEYRIGNGFDVHRLVKGRDLIIGGIQIPYEKGLLGHSDADVLIHALIDAMLGSIALGDIGKHFPDTDDSYKGISSVKLLLRVDDIIKKHKYQICNIDITIIAQKPKMLPYIESMRMKLSEALAIDISQLNIKATTTETLGFVGREEGIAVQAVCMLARI